MSLALVARTSRDSGDIVVPEAGNQLPCAAPIEGPVTAQPEGNGSIENREKA